MANAIVQQRLKGIQKSLIASYEAGIEMSSASKGQERDLILNSYLKDVLPPVFRFGSGDVTDSKEYRSGQIDIVVEYPFSPSLPIIGGSSRLYLAESVAAAIEVKSNIANQWQEVQRTARQLGDISRELNQTLMLGDAPPEKIPLFAVAYKGWSNFETLQKNLLDEPTVFAILIIESGLYYSKYGTFINGSEWALWGLVIDLQRVSNSLASASPNIASYMLAS